MKKNTKTKIIALVSASIITITSVFNIPFSRSKTQTKNNLPDLKPYCQIIKDIESFKANMDIVKFYDSRYVRLNINENQPIFIVCDKNIEERERTIIEKAIAYYNKIFESINENYKFEIKEEYVSNHQNKTVINIINQNDLAEKYGANGRAITQKGKLINDEGYAIINATMLLDWDTIKKYEDDQIYGIILHEFGHILGLNDLENSNDFTYYDTTTFMNTTASKHIKHLFPNDYAILQALYSNEYTKHQDYNKAVNVVNNKIATYTELFYQAYADTLLINNYASKKLNIKTIENGIEWCQIEAPIESTSYLSLNDDYTYFYTLINFQTGEILEKCMGKYLFIDGFVFINDLTIENGNNYNKKFTTNSRLNLMISIYLDKEESLIVLDNIRANYPQQMQKKKSSNR